MSTATKHQSESAALQAVWRVALRTGRHEIVLRDAMECQRVRFALYNAIRPVRTGKLVDAELSEAAAECTVLTEGSTLAVQRRTDTPAMQAVLASLEGIEGLEEVAKTPEEVEVERSQARLQELLGIGGAGAGEGEGQVSADSPVPGARTTPYYSR